MPAAYQAKQSNMTMETYGWQVRNASSVRFSWPLQFYQLQAFQVPQNMSDLKVRTLTQSETKKESFLPS